MNEYKFTITNETGEQGGRAVAGETSSSDTKKVKTSGQRVATAGLVAWSKVKPFVSQFVNYEINQVNLRTGQNEYAERVKFYSDLGNRGLSILESAIAGYAVGNVAGAVIGTVVGLTGQVINVIQAQNTINTQRNLENVSRQMNFIRAGATGSRSARQ